MPRSVSLSASFYGAVVASLAFCGMAQAAHHYDVVKDFKIGANPNGVWTYMDAAPLAYKQHSFEGVPKLDVWSDDIGYPEGVFIARNNTGQTVMLENGTLTFPPDYLLLDAEANRPGAIVQFTAPIAGDYTVKGDFVALDEDQYDDTRVWIWMNGIDTGTFLFYKKDHAGDRKFHVHVIMAAGDTLQFWSEGLAGKVKPDYVGLSAKIVGP